MANLVEIDASKHSDLKAVDGAGITYAAVQHLLNLKVMEIDKAVSCFPVFITRNQHSGSWALSALTSFSAGSNLFVVEQKWDAIFTPVNIQTHPLYLISSNSSSKGYAIALDPDSEAFSRDEGEPLFEPGGKASLYLSRMSAMLESEMQSELQTQQFLKDLQELDLIKSIDLKLQYMDGGIDTIRGLHTVDEDRLHSIGNEKLLDFVSRGYLVPIYAMLMSIYQVNAIIKRHNSDGSRRAIDRISLELPRKDT